MRTGTLVGALVVLGGYTLTLWGWCQLQGPGIGFADLILPSRLCGFGAKVAAARAAGASGVAPGSTVNPNGTIAPAPTPGNPGALPIFGGGGITGGAAPTPAPSQGPGALPIFGGGGIVG